MTQPNAATRAKLRLLYPDIATRFLGVFDAVFATYGLRLCISEGLRSFERQRKLYERGRSTPGKIATYARPGHSLHHYGCALDVYFHGGDSYLDEHKQGDEVWDYMGGVAGFMGFRWGGSFKTLVDKPHMELTYGYTVNEIRQLYERGGLPLVWRSFDSARGVHPGHGWSHRALTLREEK